MNLYCWLAGTAAFSCMTASANLRGQNPSTPVSRKPPLTLQVDWLEIREVRLQLGCLRADVAGENAWFSPHPLIPLDNHPLHHCQSSYGVVTSLPSQQIACYEAYNYVYHRLVSTMRNSVEVRSIPDFLEQLFYPATHEDACQRV